MANTPREVNVKELLEEGNRAKVSDAINALLRQREIATDPEVLSDIQVELSVLQDFLTKSIQTTTVAGNQKYNPNNNNNNNRLLKMALPQNLVTVEQFFQKNGSSSFLLFRSFHGTYVSALNNGTITLMDHGLRWEQFEIVPVSDHFWKIRTWQNTYLGIREPDQLEHTVGTSVNESSCLFSFIETNDGKYQLRTSKNTYIRSTPEKSCDHVARSLEWETYEFIFLDTTDPPSYESPFASLFGGIKDIAPTVRIAIAGKTGNGKSALMNGLLNSPQDTQTIFSQEFANPESGTCVQNVKSIEYQGVTIQATDNPGFLDSHGSEVDQDQLRKMVVNNSTTTFHILLCVIPIDSRFSLAEQAVFNAIKVVYGKEAADYTIIALTMGDHVPFHQLGNLVYKWKSIFREMMGVNIPLLVTSKNQRATFYQLYQEIFKLVRARPTAFKPPQVETKVVYQPVHNCCFSSKGTVIAAGNILKPVSRIVVGDEVQALGCRGEVVFSKVYYVDHVSGERSPMYYIFHGDSGLHKDMQCLKITYDHLVFVAEDMPNSFPMKIKGLKKAQEVKVGDKVILKNHRNQLISSTVVSIEIKLESDRSTILTWDDNILVDNTLASCYEINHRWQQLNSFDMKLLFKVAPSIMSTPRYKTYIHFWDHLLDKFVK